MYIYKLVKKEKKWEKRKYWEKSVIYGKNIFPVYNFDDEKFVAINNFY